ncbi:MAG TPA: transporter substrate-binding domain-containing protein [Pseudomonadales bacterium]
MRKFLGRMTRRGIVSLLAGLLVTLPIGVNAAKDQSPVLAQIAKWGKIRVGMSGSQPPYNFVSREGKLIGMDVDIAELLAKSLDVQLEMVQMNFNELLPALESGKVDLVISGMTATLQRNMRAAFVGPYHITGKSILTRSETIAALGSNDLNREDLRIAALKGSTSEDFVRRVAPNAKLVATDTYDEAIDQLMANKAELFVADAPRVMLEVMRWPDAGLTAAQRPLTIEPIGIAVPASDPLLLNLVENYMAALESSGALEKLEEKWFKSGGWLVQLP